MAFGATHLQQVGRVDDNGRSMASLWSGTSSSWVNLNPQGIENAGALATDGASQVGYTIPFQMEAAIWQGSAASHRSLHPNGAENSHAVAVAGAIQVGTVSFPGSRRAGYWRGTAESWTPMLQGGTSSVAYGSDGKSIVGHAVNDFIKASLWDIATETWTDLNPTGSLFSEALDVDGNFQVGFVSTGGPSRAFFWAGTPTSGINLQSSLPNRFIGSVASSIAVSSSEIVVSGYAYTSDRNQAEAVQWIHPVPEPGTIAAALTGLAFYARRRARKNLKAQKTP